MTGTTHVAFLRGINVGRAKRVAMADLRTLVANLGYRDVRTLLNSAIGTRVAYLWCAEGILAGRLPEAVGRLLGDAATSRP